jgi:hypothetical protein
MCHLKCQFTLTCCLHVTYLIDMLVHCFVCMTYGPHWTYLPTCHDAHDPPGGSATWDRRQLQEILKQKERPRNSNPRPPPRGPRDGTTPPRVHFTGDRDPHDMCLYLCRVELGLGRSGPSAILWFFLFRFSIISHGRPGRQVPRADRPVPPPYHLTGQSYHGRVLYSDFFLFRFSIIYHGWPGRQVPHADRLVPPPDGRSHELTFQN